MAVRTVIANGLLIYNTMLIKELPTVAVGVYLLLLFPMVSETGSKWRRLLINQRYCMYEE